jgi:ABC-type lipoprotein export system ATPase subunit
MVYMSKTVCKLNGISKSYPSPSGGDDIEVLRDIELAIHEGETISVVGPSGSGKSTLLNVIGCLDTPTEGTVIIGDKDAESMTEGERAEMRNRYLGFVFQLHHLLPQLTVYENVMVPVLRSRKGGKAAADRAETLLQNVGLSGRSDHRPAEMSGGECLRAAIARALINRPVLLLADEPTGSLDAETSGAIGDLLFDINRTEGTSLLLVTHSEELAARAGRQYKLSSGALVS